MEELKKALELKKELDALRPIDAEREAIIMQKFRLDWNYHSNHLEGNTLTYGETKALLLFNITAQGKPLKDHIEVTGHNEAINWVIDVVKGEYPLTENFIRELHKLLLKDPYEVDAITPDGKPTKKKVHVGEYKKTPNHVKTVTGEIFRFATPEETPAKMTDLLNWYRSKIEEETINPILLASEFHYKFISIHPFDDGNGRTARIIMNFILMKYGFPPTIIKTEDKENYFAVLRLADAGNIEAFINYITQNLVYSLELMISGAKGEPIEEADDLEKELILLESRLKNINKREYIAKSEDIIQTIFSETILPLFNKLEEKQKKLFDNFYVEQKTYFYMDGSQVDEPYYRSEFGLIHSLGYEQTFRNLKIIGYDGSYTNRVYIHFLASKYIITSSRDKKMVLSEKTYGSYLTNSEINSIIENRSKAHKDYIEEKIQQKENSK